MSLTQAERDVVEASPVCLSCGHREILHSQDSEYGVQCNVCVCTILIKEGDYSHWSMLRYKWRTLFDDLLAQRLTEQADLTAVSIPYTLALPEDPPTVMRIVRCSRLALPEKESYAE